MSFATLAVISLVAIVGPLLAWPRRWHLPVILGELAAGIVLGATGSGRLQADNETFTFLADIGFALIMFVVGAQVPVRDHRLRTALRSGCFAPSASACCRCRSHWSSQGSSAPGTPPCMRCCWPRRRPR
jgi:Kef-type K+ transport system membrane component KefB